MTGSDNPWICETDRKLWWVWESNGEVIAQGEFLKAGCIVHDLAIHPWAHPMTFVSVASWIRDWGLHQPHEVYLAVDDERLERLYRDRWGAEYYTTLYKFPASN